GEADGGQRAFDLKAVIAGAEVGHQPAGGAAERARDLVGSATRPGASRADRNPFSSADPESFGFVVVGDEEVVGTATADDRQATATPGGRVDLDVGGGFRP